MRNFAIVILFVVLVGVLTEPLMEIAHVITEKVTLSSALINSSRAAKDRSLDYYGVRDIDAVIEQGRFVAYFAEAFEDALNVRLTNNQNNRTLTFVPLDDRRNTIQVTLDFVVSDNYFNQKQTRVEARLESFYKYKTAYLIRAHQFFGSDVDYLMVLQRMYIISVRN
ncbi:hypothetical protein [Alkaliphilus transvaalensis]|uniref:hypothetical protein n=1 Tax=Alkaliphilus transvaalensis TaxID=114628 RepID=UPI00047C10E1|nr:hypothetical protein [Alkaliphilus transvaalensis]